jgi:competence protein ComEC
MTLESLVALINSLIHEPQAGLLNGILFGVKANLSKELHDALITTGTLHIIALSGMNISIIVGFVNLFLLRFLRRPIANVATSFIIIGFISFVGPSPSVIRAAIMAGITLLAVSLGRQTWPLLAWILAVIIMLVLNPRWAFDLSFQLSVLATLGIILFAKKQEDAGRYPISFTVTRKSSSRVLSRISHQEYPQGAPSWGSPHPSHPQNSSLFDGCTEKRMPTSAAFVWMYRLIEDDLRVTLAAQVFTIPLILFQFHRISLVSPLSNILVGPFIGPITILGFAMVGLGLIWWPLGVMASWVVWVPLTLVIKLIELTARLPFASIVW